MRLARGDRATAPSPRMPQSAAGAPPSRLPASSSSASSRAARASANWPVAACAPASAVRSSTRSAAGSPFAEQRAGPRRTSAPRSPACAVPLPFRPPAGRRPRPRRRGGRSARRDGRAPSPTLRAPPAPLRSARARRGASRPARRRRPLFARAGGGSGKRRGTSVGRTRSQRSSSSSAANAAGSVDCRRRGHQLGLERVARDGRALQHEACAVREQPELLGQRGDDRGWHPAGFERDRHDRGCGPGARSSERASCSR